MREKREKFSARLNQNSNQEKKRLNGKKKLDFLSGFLWGNFIFEVIERFDNSRNELDRCGIGGEVRIEGFMIVSGSLLRLRWIYCIFSAIKLNKRLCSLLTLNFWFETREGYPKLSHLFIIQNRRSHKNWISFWRQKLLPTNSSKKTSFIDFFFQISYIESSDLCQSCPNLFLLF